MESVRHSTQASLHFLASVVNGERDGESELLRVTCPILNKTSEIGRY